MSRMYDVRELGRSAQGFERAWHVRCLCCIAECGGVGACPGDAMSALPCKSKKRMATWKETRKRDRERRSDSARQAAR